MNYRKDTKKLNAKKLRKVFPRSEYAAVRRGDIYYADLSGATVGSEQGGTRPVLIIQNNKGNIHSPTVIAAAITSQNKRGLPTHIELKGEAGGLSKNSTVMLEQIRTIDKTRLRDKIGHLDKETMEKVNKAIFISFGIDIDLFRQETEEIKEPAPENSKSVKAARRTGMRKHKYDETNKKAAPKRTRRTNQDIHNF